MNAHKLANTLCFGKFDDMKFQQFAVVAKAMPFSNLGSETARG
jgi:hypothetical protein